MEEATSFDSANINTLWLQNIYENLKNIESMERLANEGCNTIFEYFQIPFEQRKAQLGDVQYKNLRFMLTEFELLLTDLTPVVDENKLKEFRAYLKVLKKNIGERRLFLKESPTQSKTTPYFNEVVFFLSEFRVNIIREIAHLLYVSTEGRPKW